MTDQCGMTPDARRATMAALMGETGCTIATAAALLHVSTDTVKSWRRAANPSAPPRMAIELLALKLGRAAP